MVPSLKRQRTLTPITEQGTQQTNVHEGASPRQTAAVTPDAKDSVNQKAPEEAEDHIGPGVPGVQLHEGGRVQVQILERGNMDVNQKEEHNLWVRSWWSQDGRSSTCRT